MSEIIVVLGATPPTLNVILGGPQGPTGIQGPSGSKGDTGDTGNTGPAGGVGADGADGPAGADGATGADGADGVQLDRTGTEQEAGYTNLAGDTVYQITIEITAGPANEVLGINHGISNLDKLIHLEGYFDNGSFWRSINNLEATITATCHWALNSTQLLLVSGTGSDYSGYSGECTIWYTKTA